MTMTVRISFTILPRFGRIDDERFDDKFVPSGMVAEHNCYLFVHGCYSTRASATKKNNI